MIIKYLIRKQAYSIIIIKKNKKKLSLTTGPIVGPNKKKFKIKKIFDNNNLLKNRKKTLMIFHFFTQRIADFDISYSFHQQTQQCFANRSVD
jgi:hypothetical protein